MRPFIAVFLVCVTFCVEYASSILCYDCNSAFDPRCGMDFDPFSLGVVNCSLKDPIEHLEPVEATFCRSIKMDIFGQVRVVRQCGYLSDAQEESKSCVRRTGTGDLFITYCSCNTDLCNAASTYRVQEMAVLLFLFKLVV